MTEDEEDTGNGEGEWPMGQEPKNNPAPPKAAPKAPSGFFQAPTASPTGTRDLPITLPSLELAVLRVPVPMSAEDFDALLNTLNAMKRKLVEPPASGSGVPGQ